MRLFGLQQLSDAPETLRLIRTRVVDAAGTTAAHVQLYDDTNKSKNRADDLPQSFNAYTELFLRNTELAGKNGLQQKESKSAIVQRSKHGFFLCAFAYRPMQQQQKSTGEGPQGVLIVNGARITSAFPGRDVLIGTVSSCAVQQNLETQDADRALFFVAVKAEAHVQMHQPKNKCETFTIPLKQEDRTAIALRLHQRANDFQCMREKAQNEANNRKRKTDLSNVPSEELREAKKAGTEEALQCTLRIFESITAASMLRHAMRPSEQAYNGELAIKGKISNASKHKHERKNNQQKTDGVNTSEITDDDDDEEEDTIDHEELNTFKATLQAVIGHPCAPRYGKIELMMDADDDGVHIKGLVLNALRELQMQDLFDKGRVVDVNTPLLLVLTEPEPTPYFTFEEFEQRNSNADLHSGVLHVKGLNTLSAEQLHAFTQSKQFSLRRTLRLHEGCADALGVMFSGKCSNRKKQMMRNTAHTLVQAQDATVESVVRNDIASAMSNIDREKLASIIDGKTRVQRQCISPVYKHFRRNPGEFPMRVPDMTAFAAHAVHVVPVVHAGQCCWDGANWMNHS